MKKPLEKCVNGCDAPPKPPSWVLCAKCFAELSKRMHGLLDRFTEKVKPPPWDRLLWGVVFTSHGQEPILVGHSWDRTLCHHQSVLTFSTRVKARAWCVKMMEKWKENPSLQTWRVQAVRVRERVEVVADKKEAEGG